MRTGGEVSDAMNIPLPVGHWSLKSCVEQLIKCGFQCEGGPIENNDAFRWLVGSAKVGPEFMPGQGVFFEVTADAAGVALTQWVHFYIVGCQMESDTDSRYFTYTLSYDPPGPYHYGTVHFSRIRGEKLRLVKP